jgi:3-methyladenine DNA glycosylase AlkD
VEKAQIEAMVTNPYMGSKFIFKSIFCKKMSEKWREEKDNTKRRCGYAFLYYLARDKKNIKDDYFYPILEIIKNNIQNEENFVKDAINNALFAIGQRSKKLNLKCIEIANEVGKIVVNYGANSCEAIDVVKHLTSERMLQKFS